jgi:hypothetical protein
MQSAIEATAAATGSVGGFPLLNPAKVKAKAKRKRHKRYNNTARLTLTV